jgi:hypothetical protein
MKKTAIEELIIQWMNNQPLDIYTDSLPLEEPSPTSVNPWIRFNEILDIKNQLSCGQKGIWKG